MLYLVLLTVYSACMPWSVAVHRNCCYVLDNLVRWGYLQKGARDKLDAIFRLIKYYCIALYRTAFYCNHEHLLLLNTDLFPLSRKLTLLSHNLVSKQGNQI